MNYSKIYIEVKADNKEDYVVVNTFNLMNAQEAIIYFQNIEIAPSSLSKKRMVVEFDRSLTSVLKQ